MVGSARSRIAAQRARYEGSAAQEFVTTLKTVDVFNWTTMFGATLLLSIVPLIILLSSLANQRIDDDLSQHIGLDHRGSRVISGLFRATPGHSAFALIVGVLIGFAGSIALASSLQAIYERLFGQPHRGWSNLPRLFIWVLALLGVLILEGILSGPVRDAGGQITLDVLKLVGVAIFFAWTMHFLVAGRASWRLVIRPAVVTAALWVGFSGFSAFYFSSAIVSDSKLYGTIGVVFTLLSWLIALSAVIALGAAAGSVWQARVDRAHAGRDQPARRSEPRSAA